MRGGNLMMQALSEETLKLEGDPVSLGVQVRRDSVLGSRFSVSTNGRLAFLPPPRTQAELTWLDRRGRPLGIVGEPGVYGNFDLSPDGRKLALARLMPRPSIGNQTDIWVIDLATDTATRLTDDLGNEYDPAWSPDGKHIVFNSGAEGLSAACSRARRTAAAPTCSSRSPGRPASLLPGHVPTSSSSTPAPRTRLPT